MMEYIDNKRIVEQLEKRLKEKEAELDELYGVLGRLNSYVANLIQDTEAGVRAAMSLHRKLSTRKFPKLSDASFASRYIISNTDLSSYYDFFELPNDSGAGILLCDSKGFGISAVMMSIVISLLETSAAKSPKTFVQTVRDDIKKHVKKNDHETASMLCMVFERSQMNLRYCSIGTPGIFIARGPEVMHLTGTTTDVMNTSDIEEKSIKLAPGDKIIVANRGIVFSQDRNGDKLGIERIKNCLAATVHIPIADVINNIGFELDNFTEGNRLRLCGDMVIAGMELARKMLYVV